MSTNRGEPQDPHDLVGHACLVYSSVQGDDRWQFSDTAGRAFTVPVQGPLRSNNLSALLAAHPDLMDAALVVNPDGGEAG